jgi:hypothetical protein
VLAPLLVLFVRFVSLRSQGEDAGFRQLLGLAAPLRQSGTWSEELLPTKQREAEGGDGPDLPKSLGSTLQYPPAEEWLRGWYRKQACPEHAAVLGCAALRAHAWHMPVL